MQFIYVKYCTWQLRISVSFYVHMEQLPSILCGRKKEKKADYMLVPKLNLKKKKNSNKWKNKVCSLTTLNLSWK